MNSVLIKSILGSVVIGLVVFILLLSLAPDAVPFSGNNYGWDGMQQIDSTYHVQPITSLSSAVPGPGSVLLVVSPTSEYSVSDAQSALNFVRGGGTLVVSDRSGYANSLLFNMSAHIFITQDVVRDPLYNWKSPDLPIALIQTASQSQYRFLNGVGAVAFDTPSSLVVTSPSASVVGYSSPYSASYNVTGAGTLTEGKFVKNGPFPIVAVESIGQGKLIVIGGSSFFKNSVLSNADNKILASNLLSNETVYIDTSHWPVNVGESLKAQFLSAYATLAVAPYRYLFTLGAVAFCVAILLPVFGGAAGAKSRRAAISIEDANSRYNEKILNKIRRDRERYGVAVNSQ